MKIVKDLLIDENGQGMVEYALIIALIAVALVAAVAILGTKLYSSFGNSSNKIGNV